METINIKEIYPVSTDRLIQSSRRLSREKVLQAIYAFSVCDTEISELVKHIFFRVFNFDEYEDVVLEKDKYLNPKQIMELESDTTIVWTEEHYKFADSLLKAVISRRSEIDTYLSKHSAEWHPDRISPVDKYIILIAITEMLDFPEIPPKVSINEALEISKMYSEEKSKTFINGILDSIFKKMQEDGVLNKSGRGLLDKKEQMEDVVEDKSENQSEESDV